MPGEPVGVASNPLVALFDQVAESYDRVGPSFFRLFAEELVKAASIAPGSRVLDLATGSGAVLLAAAKPAGEGGRLDGIDLSAGMLAQAARDVRRGAPGRVRLHRMDAAALAFSSQGFDRVLCGFGLDLCADPAAVLAESHRVLVPSGRVALTVWAADCPYFLWLARSLDACQSQLKIRSRPSMMPAKTERGLRALFEGAGFTDVRIERVEKEVVYTDPEEWWQSLWTHCPRGILERMRKSTLGGVKDCLQRRAGALTPNGKILAEFRAYLAVGRKG